MKYVDERTDRQTDRISPLCTNFILIMQRTHNKTIYTYYLLLYTVVELDLIKAKLLRVFENKVLTLRHMK